jgi:CubicO group peptidase (beta-lactamase class C family)
VLRDEVMAPIGASDAWEWRGYRNSVVEIGGRPMESVSGGSHWGGGMFISTRDHARFGLLHLRRGRWGDRQLLSERWIDQALTPTAIKPTYGFLWWLNTDRALYPSAPASSYFALGAGTNLIWVNPEHDLVAVVRWIENRETDGFVARVLAAVEPAGAAAAPRPPSLRRLGFVARAARR